MEGEREMKRHYHKPNTRKQRVLDEVRDLTKKLAECSRPFGLEELNTRYEAISWEKLNNRDLAIVARLLRNIVRVWYGS